jgi:redox-sensitive bicupin YhaK (pirin superfamily)
MIREIETILKSRPTIEGAGVHLNRAFGYNEVPMLDPFLLLDDFGSNNPRDYILGFPWHPHRGIETVTYVLDGEVNHEDSIGNAGTIGSGDVQWMTAGSGIIHQEMPQQYTGYMRGLQLWVNLPKSEKMMHPRYRDVRSDTIPEVRVGDGTKVKIISGELEGVRGPVRDIVVDIEYLDVSMEPGIDFTHPTKRGHKAFAFVVDGEGRFEQDSNELIGRGHVVLYGDGEEVGIMSGDNRARFLLISGEPLDEPVAWYGPIVMNTDEDLKIAFDEYRKGTFLKHE